MPLKILLIAIVVSLSGCACVGTLPTKRIWEFDRADMVCGEYEIIQYEPKLRVRHLRDLPLNQCPAIFGFSAGDLPKVLDYMEDAIACAKAKCK